MKPTDLYYMLNDEGSGFYLVTKEFWKEKMHIDDSELTAQYPEIWEFLPHWKGEKSNGFSEEADSVAAGGFFRYHEGMRNKNKKGIQILQSLGIQQVLWGRKTPVKKKVIEEEWDFTKDTTESLLKASLESLKYSKHPDFGKPTLLMERIKKFLERL